MTRKTGPTAAERIHLAHRLTRGLRRLFFGPAAVCPCLSPMPALAAAMTAGLVIVAEPVLRLGVFPVFAFLWWLCRRRLRLAMRWVSLAVPLLFAGASLHGALLLMPAEQQAARLDGRLFVLSGTVADLRETAYGGCLATIRQDNGIPVYLVSSDLLEDGSRISVRVRGSRPSGQRNPGGFDEARWLAGQGIFLKAEPLSARSTVLLLPAPRWSLRRWGAALRRLFGSLAQAMLPADRAALLSGLLLGDTDGLSDADRYAFRESGLAHLTSVSGANVAYVLLPVTSLLRRSGLRRSGRLWLTLAALAAFGFITGWQTGVTRAIFMSAAVAGARLFRRRADAGSTLALAVLVLLTFRPLSALSAGFWLSAAATAALIYGSGPLAETLTGRLPVRIPESLVRLLATSLCAQLAVLPMLSRISGNLFLPGLLVNLPASPLAGLITVLASVLLPAAALMNGLPAVFPSWLLPWLARSLRVCLDLLAGLAAQSARLRFGRLFCSQINLFFWLAGLFLLLAILLHLNSRRLRRQRCCRLLAFAACPLLLAGLAWNILAWRSLPAVQVWFLDVGQGDAILIRTRSGATVLIDGGRSGCGYQVVLPAMDALAISRIDLVIATHGHDDHAGGLIELLESRRAACLILPAGLAEAGGPGHASGLEQDLVGGLVKTSVQAGIKVQTVQARDTIVLDRSARLTVLYPDIEAATVPPGETDGNERSLQLLAELAGQRLLLTADCTAPIEEWLSSRDTWPQADILKVAHHGSRLTTNTGFLAAVRPAIAIISVGPNLYGHPAADTLRRLADSECRILRTDEGGAVVCSLDPDKRVCRSYMKTG